MEAAGIEPASEDIRQKASTCLSRSILSHLKAIEGENCLEASLDIVSPAWLGANPAGYPAERRSPGAAGTRPRNGMPTN